MHRVHPRKFYSIYCAEDCSPATSEQRGMSPHTPSGQLGCKHSVPGPHTGAPWGPWGLASSGQPASPASQDARSQRLTNKPFLQPALSPAAGAFVLESPSVSCDPQKSLTPCILPSASEKDASMEVPRLVLHRNSSAACQPHPSLPITQYPIPRCSLCWPSPFLKVAGDTRPLLVM